LDRVAEQFISPRFQQCHVGLTFSDKKIIPRNSEQVRTDGSSVGIPPVSRTRKTSEFRSEQFLGREKPSEFRSEPFLERETPSEFRSEPNLGKRKPSEFPSEPFLERENPSEFRSEQFLDEKTSEFRSEPFSEKKYLGIPFRIIFGREKTWEKTTFSGASLNFNISRNPVPFRVMEWTLPKYSESHGMSTLFRGMTKTIPSLFRGIFSERNFDGNPSVMLVVKDNLPRTVGTVNLVFLKIV
jgi:hypothetical protein